jgi:hypothetical protein
MIEKLKKHGYSWMVFLINILLLLLGYQAIKGSDKNTAAVGQDNQTQIQPLSQETLEAQNKITTDRENKLRNLNNYSKQLNQNQETIQTTTTTPAATPTKSSTQTKTS